MRVIENGNAVRIHPLRSCCAGQRAAELRQKLAPGFGGEVDGHGGVRVAESGSGDQPKWNHRNHQNLVSRVSVVLMVRFGRGIIFLPPLEGLESVAEGFCQLCQFV